MNDNKNPWVTLDKKEIYKNPWITVNHHNVINPGGNKGIYGTVEFAHTAIGVVVLDKDYNTYIVGQYRFPLNFYSWEIPEGGGEKGEDPLVSAQRELSEECGIKAEKWTLIQNFHLSNSVTDEAGYLFIAQDLSHFEAHPDDNEELKTKKIPFQTLFEMVLNGDITDAMTIMAVYKTNYLIQNKKI
jgi:8-oxo-dGTP pyrophosphatase MutT (NUDIX family)